MKHTFAYLCAILVMTATTPDKAFAQTQVSPFVPGSTIEGVCYYLPRTALRIVVTAEREIQSPGELNQYAFKYMRINDAPSEASERWSITDIQLQPYGVPDRAKAYSIALRGRTVAPLVNLHTEADNITFDEAKQRSHDIWQEMLGRIEVSTPNKEDKVKFYSGLYHALLGRGVCSDVNGAYPRNDGSVGKIPEKDGKPAFNVYNTDAMWGGQWNLTQLWMMAYPEHISDFISSHLQVYKDCGWLASVV